MIYCAYDKSMQITYDPQKRNKTLIEQHSILLTPKPCLLVITLPLRTCDTITAKSGSSA